MLLHHEYKTAFFYYEDQYNLDYIFEEVMRATNAAYLTNIVYNYFNDTQMNLIRDFRNEVYLHIFIFDNVISARNIKNVERNTFPYDHLIVLLMFDDGQSEIVLDIIKIIANIEAIQSKALFVTLNGKLYTLNRNGHTEIMGLPIMETGAVKTRSIIDEKFNKNTVNFNLKNITVYFNYMPPKSKLVKIRDSFYFIGGDGYFADILIKHLNSLLRVCFRPHTLGLPGKFYHLHFL